MPPSGYNNRSDFIRRLAYFLIGTAIGLVLLGIINEQRKRAMNQSPAPQPQHTTTP